MHSPQHKADLHQMQMIEAASRRVIHNVVSVDKFSIWS